jgi:Capsule assembly protein Wzi
MVAGRIGLALCALVALHAEARGVSPYLPLHQSPEIERAIERLLILADMPVLKRPIAAATVFDALDKGCARDALLCEQVKRYLTGYMRTAGIEHLSVDAGVGGGTPTVLPNEHGMDSDSSYQISAGAFWQPSDHVLLNGGVFAYEGDTTPTGSFVSIGSEYMQVDIGYRDHWLSPMTDSAMLLSTQAPTMPTLTVSNYTPISRAGLQYEVFIGEMSESSHIAYGDAYTTGRPRIFGVHLSIAPLPGWSLGVSRIMQYGGGDRPDAFSDLLRAFFNPSSYDNTINGNQEEFGNQVAALTSRFLYQGAVPFAVYFEYAGEDTSTLSNLRLGNAALSAGLDFPLLGKNLALKFEVSEWQNAWYIHGVYQDGLRNDDHVIGHWGGDWRTLGDGVGARTFMVQVAWEPKFGGLLEGTYRSLDNQLYSGQPYVPGSNFDLRYSHQWRQFLTGAEVTFGRDVFGATYGRVSAFLRF